MDRTLKHPIVVIEDVLVKMRKFIFSANFLILDMDEDEEIPIILGRPFLGTERALIDVHKGEIKQCAQDEEVTFKVFKVVDFPNHEEDEMQVDISFAGGKATPIVEPP